MANDQLVLLINKVSVSPDRSYLKYNQAERGKIVDITVVGNDGINPYDLSGKDIIFNETKKDNKTIIDGGGGLHSGKFIRTADNDKQGKFSYQFCDYAYQQSGECNFEFTADSKHIDVSSDFYIDITSTGTLKPDNSSYVSDLESFKASYNALLQTTSNRTDAWLDQTKQTLDSQVTDKLNGLNAQMQDTIKKANEYGNAVNNLQTQWDNELKAITNKADGDTTAAVNAINQKYSDDFARLQANFTQWQTTTINSFNQKAQSILNKVNSASDTTTQLQTQVTDAVNTMKTLMQKLDSYDFTKFVTGEQIKNYPTKDEVKAMMDNAGKVKTVDKIQPDSSGNVQTDHYTKAEVDSKTSGTVVTAYDIASKTPTKETDRYIDKRLVDQGVLGPFADAINNINGTDNITSAVDVNTLVGETGKVHVYKCGNSNNTNTPSWTSYHNGYLIALNWDGYAKTQLWFPTSSGNYAQFGMRYWEGGDASNWSHMSTTDYVNSQITSLQNTVNNLKTLIANAGKLKTITVNGGAKISPDDSGNANITVDLSSKANQSDLNNTNNRVTAMETGYMKKPTVISKADYDKLATKDPNTLYEITE